MGSFSPGTPKLDQWINRHAISFSLDASADAFNAAVDRIMGLIGDGVEVLGLGEALHGGEEFLVLRNRLFARLVEKHGFSAIAVESSFPRSRIVNEFVSRRGEKSFDAIRDAGFSHGFGALETNRELVAWVCDWNADTSHPMKVQFHGFDSPTEMMGTDSPRNLLLFALDFLASMQPGAHDDRRKRVEDLLGSDADWEDPQASMDPGKSIGLSPAATRLRTEAEDLITALRLGRPEFSKTAGVDRYLEAEQHASGARMLLNYHAELARASDNRIALLLAIRDAMMADNLSYILARQRGRGKVLVFAHNSHLKRGQAHWQLGPHALSWWPAGAQISEMLGARYAAIGTALGRSHANGIAPPEPDTLEARLLASPGPVRFLPTRGYPTSAESFPTRTASAKNPTYFPLSQASLDDFAGLIAFDSVTYARGGPALP